MDKHQHIIKSEEDMEEERDQFVGGSGNDKKKRSGNCSTTLKRGTTMSTSNVTGGSICPMRCCQAERCSADLNDAKQYHKRHKVCEFHSKAQVVLVAGVGQRFCQQCSRFHELSEFDEAKRSCRRRLAGHNERRRKSSSDSHGEGSGSSSSRKGSSGSKENGCGKADHDRGRNQITSMQENATAFKHFEIR